MRDNYMVESWDPLTPHDRDRTDCATWPEADDLARALAAEGQDVAIYRLECSYMGALPDEAALNGVRPGIDFPATLAGGRRYAA